MALSIPPLTFPSQKSVYTFPLPSMARSHRGVLMASTLHVAAKNHNPRKPFSPPREVHVQVTHSMPPQKIDIFKSLEDWAENNILVLLKPVEKSWQPQDFLPDPSSDGFHEEV